MTGAGIYKIEHTASGRVYVGSAVCIRDRWDSHRHYLRNRKHKNSFLQRAWNKHGESAFVFAVLELVSNVTMLVLREQAWIEELRAATRPNFNLCPVAGSQLGCVRNAETLIRNSAASRLHNKAAYMNTPEATAKRVASSRSPEVRAKMSAAAKANAAKTSVRFKGVPKSPETRLKMSIAAKRRSKDVVSFHVACMRAPESVAKARATQRSQEVRARRSVVARRNNAAAHLNTPSSIAKREGTKAKNRLTKSQPPSASIPLSQATPLGESSITTNGNCNPVLDG